MRIRSSDRKYRKAFSGFKNMVSVRKDGWAQRGGIDRIENEIAVTRAEDLKYGDKQHFISYLFRKHLEFLEANNVEHDSNWMQQQINKYQSYEI